MLSNSRPTQMARQKEPPAPRPPLPVPALASAPSAVTALHRTVESRPLGRGTREPREARSVRDVTREAHDIRDPRGPPPVRGENKGSTAERPRRPQVPVREWDRDKLRQETPPPERPRGPLGAARGSKDAHTPDKKERRDKKVAKRKQEDTPAKLLDDLFRKTKATPCIYWLPLTDDQITRKEEERKQRRLDRERRRQQQQLQEEEDRRKRALARELDSKDSKRTGSHSPVRRR